MSVNVWLDGSTKCPQMSVDTVLLSRPEPRVLRHGRRSRRIAPEQIEETELMRRGELYRYRDPSGVSGTGVVALVVEFPPNEDGRQWLVAKWLGPNPSVTFWPGVAELLEVHGHLGA